MPLLNDTTHVPVEKTVSAIQTCLAAHGATAILCEYDARRHVSALSCKVGVGQQDLAFRLPADWRPVRTLLDRERKVPRRLRTPEQALRVRWRILKDGVEAQLAIVDTTMVQLEQVFLPYAIMPDGRTRYERVREAQFRLPPATERKTSDAPARTLSPM